MTAILLCSICFPILKQTFIQILGMKVKMKFLKLLLNMTLIFVIATALSVNNEPWNDSPIEIERLPDYIRPINYNITWTFYVKEDTNKFDGTCNIAFQTLNATKTISLHAKNLIINETRTSVFTTDLDSITIIQPVAHIYNNVSEILVIHFIEFLPPGSYILNLEYIGMLNSNGTHGISKQSYIHAKTGKIQYLIASNFKPNFARYAFPCLDEPALKATFSIYVKHHTHYVALSNMRSVAPEYLRDINGRITMYLTRFETTPLMSTYLVAIVVSNYIFDSNTNITISAWCRPQWIPEMKLVLDFAEKSEIAMTQITNYCLQVPKMDHVIVPQYALSASENWGLIIYRESEILYHEEWDVRPVKFRAQKLVVQGMAHQWFGSLVTPKWWSYVWLSEGFSAYFKYYIQVVGYWRGMNDLAGNVQNNVLEQDIGDMNPVTTEVNSPEDFDKLFSNAVYKKAPIILRMLQQIVSYDVFKRGLFKYIYTNQYDSASPDDLWYEMQTALDESDIYHDAYRLKDVMDTWINQKKYPVVTVTRNYHTGEATISQECFLPFLQNVYENRIYKWWIPISYTTQTNFNFSNTVPRYWLRPQDSNITINGIYSEAWLIVNLQRTGYYLVNYDAWNWQQIANYLNSDDYTNIHPLNRAQIIFDSFHLLKAGQFRVSIFKDIVKYFKQELNYIPWYSIEYVIAYIHEASYYSDNLYFKDELLFALNNIIKHIGYEEELFENKDLTRVKRAVVLDWACILGDNKCIKKASDKLVDQLLHPDKKISPDLKEWIYCRGIMKANKTIWNTLFDEYVKKPTADILCYLSCSENPDIIIHFLSLALSHDSPIQEEEEMCKKIYKYVLARHANKDAVLDFILTTFEMLESRIGTSEALNILIDHIIKNVHSEMRINKIIIFVDRLIVSKRSSLNPRDITLIQQKIENRLSEILEKFASIHRLLSTYKED